VASPILSRMFARGESRPKWCFLAVRDDRPSATIGFRGDVQSPQLVKAFAISGDPDALAGLLEKALPAMHEHGAEAILAEVQIGEVLPGLVRSGFTGLQQRRSWRWESPWPAVIVPPEFTFKSMEEIGEAVFRELITTLFDRTRDPLLGLLSRLWGSVLAAEKTLESLKSRNAHAHWWQACFDPSGSPAGLVCPYLDAPRSGTFGLLETIPGQAASGPTSVHPERHDLIHLRLALLAKGTAVLQSRGVDEIFYAAHASWSPAFRQIGGYKSGGDIQILGLEF
jgi:hypothetical protein